MKEPIHLAYGESGLELSLDPDRFDVTVLEPCNPASVGDLRDAFAAAARAPLRDVVSRCPSKNPNVTIVISDHTRPTPDALLVPLIVETLGVPDDRVTILVATGTHRETTGDELAAKLGEENLNRFRVMNHRCGDRENLIDVGRSSCGGPVLLNRAYVGADIRVATGFVEPHFFAGFSGGPKAVVPGVAGLETIEYAHRPELIADSGSTWGEVHDNPLQMLLRDMVRLSPPHSVVNVTMNRERQVTGVFCGDFENAHDEACAAAKKEAMVDVSGAFPAVVTTNSGYPLDQNFYQTVKGISAASRIVEAGGLILVASECRNGLPEDGEFAAILAAAGSAGDLLREILAAGAVRRDVWQAQVFLQCLTKSRIVLYSALSPEDRGRTRTGATENLEETLEGTRTSLGAERLPVAVMPLGPLTIPSVQVE
jgi:nickel-dependent lactate racemase